MTSENKFGLLRNVLGVFGLAPDAVDDIVNWIADLLAGKSDTGQAQGMQAKVDTAGELAIKA